MTSIAHPRMPDNEFASELEHLAYEVARYGIDRFKPDPNDPLEMIRFRQLVHEGWKLAQNRVLRLVRATVDETQELARKVKNSNRRGDRQSARSLGKVHVHLNSRLDMVSHACDAILWNIFANQHHLVRRFSTGAVVKNLDADNLFRTMVTVDDINTDPNKFALACDLTTCMHVADVVIIDQSSQENPITIAELKSGKANSTCLDILQEATQTGCARNLAFNLAQLSASELQQFERFARQAERSASVQQVINTGEGVDLATGNPIAIPDETFVIESYDDEVVRMFTEVQGGASHSLGQADGCLHLALYSDLRLMPAFEQWMQGENVEGPRWDYRQVFSASSPRPTLSLGLPFELVKQLYTGRLRLLACLDMSAWFESAKSRLGCDIEFETAAASRRLKNQRGIQFFRDRAIRLVLNDDYKFYLGGGAFSKIAFDFYAPVDSLRPFLSAHRKPHNSHD
jgi:hypothetical protein